jgi:hypothetical protein
MSLSPDGHMQVFTIYHRPADFPDTEYLVRTHVIHGGAAHPGAIVGTAKTLEGARWLIPSGADVCFRREQEDVAPVVESWL